MSEMKRKAPDSREQGERKVSRPTGGRGGAGRAACGREGRQGQAGAPQPPRGRAPLLLGRGGPGRALGACWDPCACCASFPSTASGPAHQPAWQGQNRPLGTVPQGHLAPQRCSMAVPFALSPPACMLCGRADADPNICGPIHKRNGLCAHTFCLVSSPRVPVSIPPGTVPSTMTPNEILLFSIL